MTIRLTLDYVWEKLHLSVLTLSTGDGSPRERLSTAYFPQLFNLDDAELPDNVPELTDIVARLARTLDGETSVLRGIDDDEARQIIERLIGLYDRVCRSQADSLASAVDPASPALPATRARRPDPHV